MCSTLRHVGARVGSQYYLRRCDWVGNESIAYVEEVVRPPRGHKGRMTMKFINTFGPHSQVVFHSLQIPHDDLLHSSGSAATLPWLLGGRCGLSASECF